MDKASVVDAVEKVKPRQHIDPIIKSNRRLFPMVAVALAVPMALQGIQGFDQFIVPDHDHFPFNDRGCRLFMNEWNP
jgi:hypothetical protein